MYKITSEILSLFDIKRMKNRCNYPDCNKKPEKEIFIYEYTIHKKKGIAKLYLCEKHIGSARSLIKKIKSIEPKAIIESVQTSLK